MPTLIAVLVVAPAAGSRSALSGDAADCGGNSVECLAERLAGTGEVQPHETRRLKRTAVGQTDTRRIKEVRSAPLAKTASIDSRQLA